MPRILCDLPTPSLLVDFWPFKPCPPPLGMNGTCGLGLGLWGWGCGCGVGVRVGVVVGDGVRVRVRVRVRHPLRMNGTCEDDRGKRDEGRGSHA